MSSISWPCASPPLLILATTASQPASSSSSSLQRTKVLSSGATESIRTLSAQKRKMARAAKRLNGRSTRNGAIKSLASQGPVKKTRQQQLRQITTASRGRAGLVCYSPPADLLRHSVKRHSEASIICFCCCCCVAPSNQHGTRIALTTVDVVGGGWWLDELGAIYLTCSYRPLADATK